MRMKQYNILIIGQLPKEAGGTYTTGIARVVENLYRKKFADETEMYWYFTNVPQSVAAEKCTYEDQYNGYQKRPLKMLANILCHPFRTIREWKHYKTVDEVNPLRFEFYKANIQRVIAKVQPDLIHLHGAGMSPLYYANMKTNIPLLITFHGVMYNEGDKTSWHFKPGYQATMQMADYFTVLNQETKRKALALGMPENKCTTIPNGVDTNHFYYSEGLRMEMREKFNVQEDELVFMTTGVVIDRKGQYDFILALEQLGINYQYWIIGRGPDEQKIVDYVAAHHLEQKVKLLGYVDGHELIKYLSTADVYAHVSTTEGQALSEIEAYATGLRVIVRKEIAATVVGDASSDHHTYYVLDMDNQKPSEMKVWLQQGNIARKSKGNYDWSVVARKYGELYKKILDTTKR